MEVPNMLGKKILIELQEYVEGSFAPILYSEVAKYASEEIMHSEIEDFINTKRNVPFSQVLFNFIDKKGYTDSEIYKKALIDRRHFSKIRSNPQYRPGKNTTIALALALHLTQKETEKLMSSAGFSLSDSETFDLVIQFCLEKRIYDMDEVNQALEYFSLKPIN